jgi:uncharacterized protein YwqG
MTVQQVKERLYKQATVFETGGFRPQNSENESWIGKVYLYKPEESIPLEEDGKPMIPLFQLCLSELEFVPESLKNTKVITVFISEEIPVESDPIPNGKRWILREYSYDDTLIINNLSNPKSYLKSFPLSSRIVEDDSPMWDSYDIPDELSSEVLRLEKEGVIDDYYDIVENYYQHKIGGYPAFCQPGIKFEEGFEFVLQISSDEKANLNVIDGGSMYFAKNKLTSEWLFYCDFY